MTALIYSAALYWLRPVFEDYRRWLLASLRFLVVFVLCLLLLEPFIKRLNYVEEKPVLAIGIDNSLSMRATADSQLVASNITKWIKDMQEGLNEKTEIRFFSFGEQVLPTDTFGLSDKLTDISQFMDYVENIYEGRNLSGVVLLTDGLFNRGKNPVYSSASAQFPVHTVRFGDTARHFDISIEHLRYNRITFSEAIVPVDVVLSKSGDMAAKTNLRLLYDGVEVERSEVVFGPRQGAASISFKFDAGKPGIKTIEAFVEPLTGEADVRNNRRRVFMEVLDARRKIAILSAFPHPDAGWLFNTLSNIDRYEAQLLYSSQASQAELALAVQQADVIVLYQFTTTGAAQQLLHEAIKARRLPVIYFEGTRTQPAIVNRWNTPFSYPQIKGGLQEMTASLHMEFNLFTIPKDAATGNNEPTGLYGLFDVPSPAGEHFDLLHRRIGSIGTRQPLWTLGIHDGKRYALVTAEGFWKWALKQRAIAGQNMTPLNDMLQKTVQFVAGREQRKRLRVETSEEFQEGENVKLRGEVYNPSFEKVGGQEVLLRIWNEQKIISEGIMNTVGEEYQREIKGMQPGIYYFSARSSLNNENLKDSGVFIIHEALMEYNSLRADHPLLERLSKSTGGVSVMSDGANELLEHLNKNAAPVRLHEESDTVEIIELQWIFWMLLVLFATEWTVRRYGGKI